MKCPAGSCGLAILIFMDSKESLIQHCGRQAGNAPLSQSKQRRAYILWLALNYNSLLSFADTFVWI